MIFRVAFLVRWGGNYTYVVTALAIWDSSFVTAAAQNALQKLEKTVKSLGPAKGKHILPPICSSKKKMIAYIKYITIIICSAI